MKRNFVAALLISATAAFGMFFFGYNVGARDGVADAKRWRAIADKSLATSEYSLTVVSQWEATAQNAEVTARDAVRTAGTWQELSRRNEQTAHKAMAAAARWERIANGYKRAAEDCLVRKGSL